MPTFICEEAYAECNAEYVGNAEAQSNCTTSIQDQCGALDPNNYTAAAVTTPSASSTAAGMSTGTASGTAASGTAPVTTTSSKAGAVPTAIGHSAAAVALGLFAYLL
ncbi:MAG: hypothetical protein SEPTF4163_004644 [Sporothrix epigloea]